MKIPQVKSGQLLVAEPFMLDPHFKRSVVLVCDNQNETGTVGFILNKPITAQIKEVIEDFPEFNGTIYYGGPVGHDSLHYIHNVGPLLEESEEIIPGLYWGGDFEKLKFLIHSELIREENIRFYIGYSGWSPGQLDEELKFGSWVIEEMHPNYAFKTKYKDLWKEVLKNKGDRYEVIAEMPDSNNLN